MTLNVGKIIAVSQEIGSTEQRGRPAFDKVVVWTQVQRLRVPPRDLHTHSQHYLRGVLMSRKVRERHAVVPVREGADQAQPVKRWSVLVWNQGIHRRHAVRSWESAKHVNSVGQVPVS